MILDGLQTLLTFVVTLGVLVGVHEYGHFWVARRAGIRVLRFSIGFGKPLFSWFDRHGTEFVLSVVPLGGYVKMLDEREGDVPEQERHLAFNNRPVGARIAVVVAGPMANFVLSVLALWLMYLVGVKTAVPQVEEVIADTPAAVAGFRPGDQLLSVGSMATPGWQQVGLALLSEVGQSKPVEVAVLEGVPGEVSQFGERQLRQVSLSGWSIDPEGADLLESFGIVPYQPLFPAVIDYVDPQGAAAQAGLKQGDRVIAVDGEQISEWSQLVSVIQRSAETELLLQVERGDKVMPVSLVPSTRRDGNQQMGFIGVSAQSPKWPEGMVRTVQYGILEAVHEGVRQTGELIAMTVDSMWNMVKGLVSVKSLGGPLTIAKVADASRASGLVSYLYFLAMLSVSLGVLNLLPVPVLDGGHLLFLLAEWVRGEPLPEWVQSAGLRIGLTLVISIMALAMYNDISRLF